MLEVPVTRTVNPRLSPTKLVFTPTSLASLHRAGTTPTSLGSNAEPARLLVPLYTADVPGGAKGFSRVGWAHVELLGRALFPWWAGPDSTARMRVQRAMMPSKRDNDIDREAPWWSIRGL